LEISTKNQQKLQPASKACPVVILTQKQASLFQLYYRNSVVQRDNILSKSAAVNGWLHQAVPQFDIWNVVTAFLGNFILALYPHLFHLQNFLTTLEIPRMEPTQQGLLSF
jgi:hypothetical protein